MFFAHSRIFGMREKHKHTGFAISVFGQVSSLDSASAGHVLGERIKNKAIENDIRSGQDDQHMFCFFFLFVVDLQNGSLNAKVWSFEFYNLPPKSPTTLRISVRFVNKKCFLDFVFDLPLNRNTNLTCFWPYKMTHPRRADSNHVG